MPGTALAVAERKIKDLTVLAPDVPAYELMNKEIEQVVSRYAPVWENDRAGNLYLDITGTRGLFGSPADCSSRILREIYEKALIRPAVGVAVNKLVSKVATRTIRPVGLIQVNAGTEADFLFYQSIRLLPGMGAKLLRTAEITGIREIGEIAALTEIEAVSLFGKQGMTLRQMAQGIDGSRVEEGGTERRIVQQADFDTDVIDETAIRGAIEALAENGGLVMRRDKLGCSEITLAVVYSDGVRVEGKEKLRRLCVLDKEIQAAGERIFAKAAARRIRVRSIGLALGGLAPLGYEPDLFEVETEVKDKKLQEAADKIRTRFGADKLMKGIVFGASKTQEGKRLLSAGAGAYGH
jgi:DNA polymerase-4